MELLIIIYIGFKLLSNGFYKVTKLKDLIKRSRMKSSAQKAINGAIDVLTTALSTALKLPI